MISLWVATSLAGSSALWGEAGELWDPAGRLPDFSYAGYHAGEVEIPTPAVVANVRDFGAVGDGITDDSAAFQAALDATQGGALKIPAGTWRIEAVLELHHGDIVLRGAGAGRTTLLFPEPLSSLRGPAQQWSWNGGLIWISPEGSGSKLTDIQGEALRSERSLGVVDSSALVAGELVELRLTDDEDASLGRLMHNDQAEPGDCSYQQPIVWRWPVALEQVGADQVRLAQPLRLDVRQVWAPALYSVPWIREVGIEQLTIAFPQTDYPGHLKELGYNGIFMVGGVADSWIRDVVIENADNDLLIDLLTKRITAERVSFRGRAGHHGTNIAHSSDGLYSELVYQQQLLHSFSVDHRSSGNVMMRPEVAVEGMFSLDHHKDSPFENLFTEIAHPVTFWNGGSACAGPPSGARATFWNVGPPLTPPYWDEIQATLVGELTVEESLSDDGAWLEPVEDLWPANLYLAQRARRLGEVYERPDDTGDSGVVGEAPGSERGAGGCGCVSGAGGGGGWWLWVVALVGYSLLRLGGIRQRVTRTQRSSLSCSSTGPVRAQVLSH